MLPKRLAPELEQLLSRAPSETKALLLELVRRQAERRRPKDLLAQLRADSFVAPSSLDQRLLHRLDGLALALAEEFEALQLSPVAPLGTCSVVAPSSQNRILSTTRGSEVVSDPTNVLALECARRLADDPRRSVRLCTLHQVLRAQPVPPIAGFAQHFRLFVLVEAGPGRAEDGFEVEAVVRHLGVYDRLFDAAARELGCEFPRRRAVLRCSSEHEVMAARVRAALEQALPHVAIVEEPLESSYYEGLRVQFGAHDKSGEFCPIGDLGRFDWLAQLTANRRQRFIASGFGLQLLPIAFR